MKVSIIVPVYNAEKFIGNCIDSVLAQTKLDWEAIFVNDGSKDRSAEIISGVKDNRILLVNQDNSGPSAARNRGIREAKGEYIFFLDADDTITPNCLEMLCEIAQKNDSDYVQGTYFEEHQQTGTLVLKDKKEIKTLLLNYNKIPYMPHNRLVRRRMIIEHELFFDERIRVREDFLWMTFIAKCVNSFASCGVPTYHREYNEGSLTNNVNIEREILGYRVLIEEMCKNIDDFLIGEQKNLILDVIIMIITNHFYNSIDDLHNLVKLFYDKNTTIEKVLLNFYFHTMNYRLGVKVLHLLNRIYRF